MQPEESANRSRTIKLGFAVVGLIAAGIIAYFQLNAPDAASDSRVRNYVDIETNKPFSHTLEVGEGDPVKAPSGKMTGYAAEACFWGKDGNGKWVIKAKPDYVVLKKRIDPNSTEETRCPVCNRIVVGHNRKPSQEEIDRANAGQDAGESQARERTGE